jgi:hypothetical protein
MTRIEELEQSIDEAVEKFRLEINKHKAEIEKLKKEVALAELKESKKEGKWKPQNGDECHYRKHWGGFDYYIWEDTDTDNYMYKNIPMFPTREACEKYWHFMDTVKEKSYEFSKEEWEDGNVSKWRIDYEDERFITSEWCSMRVIGGIYFKSRNDAQYIIDNFKDELMEYWI